MDGQSRTDRPEQREQTDESLRAERELVDEVLADTMVSDEAKTDRVVKQARDKSDAVLVAAREKSDQRFEHAQASHASVGADIAQERMLEDHGVQRARDKADAEPSMARDKADFALGVARDKADQLIEKAAAQAVLSSATLANERLVEDRLRSTERVLSDTHLRRERDENLRVLQRLLPLERDSTDKYLLTERARSDEAVSTRDDFLAMVSHDLRSLLGGIVMCADLMSNNAPSDESGKPTRIDAEHIQRYAARMNRLIGDLLDVVSIDAGKLSMLAAPCDCNALFAEAEDRFRGMAAAKGVTLRFESFDGPTLVELDCERMLQVLANLITNSLKFTASAGSIVVRSQRVGEELRFSVSDSGTGIAEDMLECVFERFWQAGKNDRRGLGLGLYITRCIVEAQGGKIWAHSKLGEGTEVFIALPAVAPAAAQQTG